MASDASNSTGYGSSNTEKWRKLVFDGNSENYEIWETRFLAYLRGFNLRETILADVPDARKNI